MKNNMKKYILILLCALCTCVLNAQIRYLQLNKYNNSTTIHVPVNAIDSLSFSHQTVWFIDFSYALVGENIYEDPTFYYVGADIEFRPNIEVTPSFGECRWDFGDGTAEEIGDVVSHNFTTAGEYTITLTTDKVTAQRTIRIAEIYPLIHVLYDGDIATKDSDISFDVQCPNPYNQQVEWQWSIPNGAINASGETITTFNGTAQALGKLRFPTVGSHYVHLQILLDGRAVDKATAIVNIAENQEVPTLYYAVYGGNVMALKLVNDLTSQVQQGLKPYDLSVSAGEHAFNLLFGDETVYLIDAGKQFGYINDEYSNLGDGRILAIAKDGSSVETVISNVGGSAFQDPYNAYMEDGNLYYADRNTGVVRLPSSSRNEVYKAYDFPYYFQNNTLPWYGRGLAYGALGGCLGKVNGAWWWTKFYNGTGIYRFNDSDILKEPSNFDAIINLPFNGVVLLSNMRPKSFVYDQARGKFYFTLMDEGYSGLYCCTLDELEAIGSSKANLAPYQILHENGSALEIDLTSQNTQKEGNSTEPVGICQLALDEATGCVYFGYRPDPNNTTAPPAGLMRYNPATGKVETVIEGVQIYGVTINQTPTRLF